MLSAFQSVPLHRAAGCVTLAEIPGAAVRHNAVVRAMHKESGRTHRRQILYQVNGIGGLKSGGAGSPSRKTPDHKSIGHMVEIEGATAGQKTGQQPLIVSRAFPDGIVESKVGRQSSPCRHAPCYEGTALSGIAAHQAQGGFQNGLYICPHRRKGKAGTKAVSGQQQVVAVSGKKVNQVGKHTGPAQMPAAAVEKHDPLILQRNVGSGLKVKQVLAGMGAILYSFGDAYSGMVHIEATGAKGEGTEFPQRNNIFF